MDVQPLHELVADGDALVSGLWGIEEGEEGETGVQLSVMFCVELERFSAGRIALRGYVERCDMRRIDS